ncbi:hypothetical protein [Streptomyces canus]|uniref:hypothetical protein n=1 Tax=Streptomyces canus TaxID=58343 RepID=UPI0036E972DB
MAIATVTGRIRLGPMVTALPPRRSARVARELDAHDTGDGVWFDSRAWLVVARRS